MGIITKIEDKLGNFVERPFRDRRSVEPLIIEIALKRQLEDKKKNVLGKIIIPHSISVILAEVVYNDYRPFLTALRDSLRKSLHEWLKEKGYEVLNEIEIEFKKGSLDEKAFDVFLSYKSTGPDEETGHLDIGRPDDEADRSESSIWQLLNVKTRQIFVLAGNDVIIGSDEACDLRIDDPTVSRIHAGLSCRYGKFMLEDLGSTNGTRVNHEKVDQRVLVQGDIIMLGNVELIFEKGRANKDV